MTVGIVGYGNIGRAALNLTAAFGFDVVGVFTSRYGEVSIQGTNIYPPSALPDMRGDIDCLIMAGGSATDLPVTVPALAPDFNLVDSYDDHARLRGHRDMTDAAARSGGHTAIISAGWDPGLFSLARIIFTSVMPYAAVNTFWGRGVSQGHSQALRSIPGVRYAVQYTVPESDALFLARSGEGGTMSPTETHRRECYIVADESEQGRIEREVRSMPDYFSGYRTDIHFISEELFLREHTALPHRGQVISSGMSGKYRENRECATLSLALSSNPEFTAGVMLASARAALRLHSEGHSGAFTLADIPPAYLLPEDKDPLSLT